MKLHFLILVFFSSFSLFGQQIQKEEEDSIRTQNLEELIITATREERQLSSLPLPAQIVTKKEIKNVSSIRLGDILNEQTGLITISDFGGSEGVQLQGFDAEHTLILIDGVPLIGRSAGTLNINRITVGNIRQIEVVKGASSSLYGSEALGGVINIITDKPKEGLHGNIYYRYGTFNTHDANINFGYKKKKVGVSAFGNRYGSNGYDLVEDDELNTVEPFESYTFNTKLTYQLLEKTDLFLSGRYYYQGQDNAAISDGERLTGDSELNEWNIHTKLNHTFNEKWNSYLEVYATQYKAKEYLNDNEGVKFSESDFNQFLLRPELRVTFSPNLDHIFMGGIGWTHETLDRTYFSTRPEFNAQYVYFQYDGYPLRKLNLIIGTRFDYHSKYKSQLSPKLAARYEITHKIAVKASVGYGFKAPDFRQLYFDFTNSTVGYTVLGYNIVSDRLTELQAQGLISKSDILLPMAEFEGGLNPENSVSFNIGFQYEPIINSLSFDVNLFRNNIKDLIDWRVVINKPGGQILYSYYNVNKAYTQGMEINAVWDPIKQLKISGGYQLLYAKDKDVKAALEKGQVARDPDSNLEFKLYKDNYFGLFNRSRHMANLKIFYTVPRWKLNTNIRTAYRSKYGLFDSNSNGFLDDLDEFVDGYIILDWAINKTIYKHFDIGLGIDNLLGFTDAQNISNIPGRLYYGKLNIHF